MITDTKRKFSEKYEGSLVRLVSLVKGDQFRADEGFRGTVLGRVYKVQKYGWFRDTIGHRSVFFLYGAKFELIRRGK